jgi:LAO/AO transport system kinase
MGFDVVIIETVGVGQDEVEVVRTAHSSLVVLVPGLGDEVQALKAGILEIADVFVVNKSDREGADRTAQEIRSMMTLGDPQAAARAAAGEAAAHHGFSHTQKNAQTADAAGVADGWNIPVLKAMALRGEGIAELLDALQQHFAYLQQSGQLKARLRRRVHESYARLTRDMLWHQALEQQGGETTLAQSVEKILSHETDPYTAALSFVQNSLKNAQ